MKLLHLIKKEGTSLSLNVSDGYTREDLLVKFKEMADAGEDVVFLTDLEPIHKEVQLRYKDYADDIHLIKMPSAEEVVTGKQYVFGVFTEEIDLSFIYNSSKIGDIELIYVIW